MSELLVLEIVRGVAMLVRMGMETSKIEERVTGVPAEKIPSVLDALYAEASQNLDRSIDKAADTQG